MGSSANLIRILLVDDNPAVRQVIRETLESYPDFEVVSEASDGKTAVEQAVALHPDIVVMDIRLPGLDGIEATKHIKCNVPDSAVVGFSTFLTADTRKAMEDAGSSGCIAKEYVSDLPEVIRRLRPGVTGAPSS
jgi:DNA-binding NarL/FixJ family response regulator